MIKAIVFDFDGLIFDTETAEYRAFQEIYTAHGVELDLEVWGQWVGTDSSPFNPYDHLDECVGRPLEREAIRTWRRANYKKLIAEEQVRPGVEDCLKSAKELGLRIGLASSSPRAWVTEHLHALGLIHCFDCIRVREDVATVKPDPELYLQVIRRFGIEPEEAVAFEDSPNGALAAKRAGMYCVVVPNDVTRALPFGDVDLRLESLEHIRLAALIERLTQDSP